MIDFKSDEVSATLLTPEAASPEIILNRLERQANIPEAVENEDFIAACCWAIGREEGTALARKKNQGGGQLTAILYTQGLISIAEDGTRTLTELGRERAAYYALKQLGA